MKTHQTRVSRSWRLPNLFAALLAMAWFASTGAMASFNLATGFSDIWWNAAESGWGVNVVHQNNLMYLTFYIYRADRSPYWVSALLNYTPGSSYTFSGDLYENHGPWFGGPFTPPSKADKAGTATFTTSDGYHAMLAYTVYGVPVTKNVERYTLQNLSYSGVYDGVVDYITDFCTPASLNGQLVKQHWTMTVTHVGTSLTMVASEGPASGSCTFSGTYSQTGLAGTTIGTYTCTDGTMGSFKIDAMQRTIFGMTAQLSGNNAQCAVKGGMALLSID